MNASTLDLEAAPHSFDADTLSNEDYHRQFPDWISRSTAHQIYRYGGMGQLLLDRGVRLFTGNNATTLGSKFDLLWEMRFQGKAINEVFSVPPASVLSSSGQRRGKPYEQWRDDLKASGGEECSAEDYDRLSLMWEATENNDRAMELLSETTDCQRSVFWIDKAGHKRRARWDGATKELVYDVKTTSSTWEDLAKSFLNYGYFWQASWYGESARAVGYGPFRMPFICVQTVPPYECRVVVPPEEFVDAAWHQIEQTLNLIVLRRETGAYLSEDYGDEQELSCPAWMWRQEVYGNDQ